MHTHTYTRNLIGRVLEQKLPTVENNGFTIGLVGRTVNLLRVCLLCIKVRIYTHK